MRKIISIVLVLVLLASAVSLAITPAAAYEEKIPFAGEDNELTKDELVNDAILPYMLGEGDHKLDDVGDAAYIYAYWDGKPRTIIDQADREVKFYRPIERVVACPPDSTKAVIALGACDKLIGIISSGRTCTCAGGAEKSPVCAAEVCGGRLFEITEIHRAGCICADPELIVSLHPDLIFGFAHHKYVSDAPVLHKKTGIPVVCYLAMGRGHKEEEMYGAIEFMGTVLEKEEEAEELMSFVKEKLDKLEKVVSQIPEEKKPKVYFAARGVSAGRIARSNRYDPLELAGGINVAADLGYGWGATTTKEQIIKWNPDIIVLSISSSEDDPLELLLANNPELHVVNAVKNKSVYFTPYPYCCGTPTDRNLATAFYLAKLFHPEKFKDLDLEKEGNEIYEAFLGVDGLFSEYADYMVWMREYLDSQK